MIYVTSDLHGCHDKFRKLLDRIRLRDDDTLYVLGDVVDRGPENIKLVMALAEDPNICTLMGNHDYLAALMMKTFGMDYQGKGSPLREKPEVKGIFEAWLADGGEATWREFVRLTPTEKETVLRFLESRPMFAKVRVGGQTYHLSHTVPERSLMQDPDRLSPTDYVFSSPEYDRVYFPDRILVTGHTPTGLIEAAFAGRIWKKNNHIALDCGAVFGYPLGCLCLDTGEEFYAE